MENGVVKSAEVADCWAYESLKDARKECKKKHYSWPYYYILRINNQGGLMYKP